MSQRRSSSIGTIMGAAVGIAMLICFPASMGTFLQAVVTAIPGKSYGIYAPLIFITLFLGGGWLLGCAAGTIGSFMSRRKLNGVLIGALTVVIIVGIVLACLCNYTFAQGAVYTTAMFLCNCWVFQATGSPVGPLTENRAVGSLLTAGFVVALFLSFNGHCSFRIANAGKACQLPDCNTDVSALRVTKLV